MASSFFCKCCMNNIFISFIFFNLFNHLNALDNVRIALLKVQKVPREVATRIFIAIKPLVKYDSPNVAPISGLVDNPPPRVRASLADHPGQLQRLTT